MMIGISILDFFSAIFLSITLFVLIIYRKSYFNKGVNILFGVSISLLLFYHIVNFLEWARIIVFLAEYEDYFAILIPVTWIIFFYMVIEKRTQENLKEREELLKRAYKNTEMYKDLFAHDVKNIFQNILSATDLCKLYLSKFGDVPTEYIEIFHTIEDQIKRGRTLAQNVYKLSKVRNLEPQLKEMNLIEILKQSIKNILNSNQDKDIEVGFTPKNNKIYVKADDFLLDVFENILTNSIIHNNKEKVRINIYIDKEQDPTKDIVQIEIMDNGPGIEDSIKEKLFKDVIKESKKGMGLGLFLVKNIIQNYKGEIRVEDITNFDFQEGSKFVIILQRV